MGVISYRHGVKPTASAPTGLTAQTHHLFSAPDEIWEEISMEETDLSALSARAGRAAARSRRWQRFSQRPTVATAGGGRARRRTGSHVTAGAQQ